MARRQDIVIGSKRLYVRPWREEDLEPLRLIFGDPEVTRYTGDGRPWTGDRVARLVRWGIALLCLQGPLPLVVATLGIADSFRSLRPRVDDDGGMQ